MKTVGTQTKSATTMATGRLIRMFMGGYYGAGKLALTISGQICLATFCKHDWIAIFVSI